MDAPNVSKTPWATLLSLPIGFLLQFAAAYTVIGLLGEVPINSEPYWCSFVFVAPGIMVALVLRNTKSCNLRTVALSMLIGWLLIGLSCGTIAATNDTREGGRFPPRTFKKKAAEGVLFATFGMQFGALGGAFVGWLITHQMASLRSRKPFTGRSPNDSSNITT